jgi:hypothetical protein
MTRGVTAIIAGVVGIVAFAAGYLSGSRKEWSLQGPGEVFLVEKHSGETWVIERGSHLALSFVATPGAAVTREPAAISTPTTMDVAPELATSGSNVERQRASLDDVREALRRREVERRSGTPVHK